MSNKDDLKAIDDYVKNRSRPAAGAPQSVIDRWSSLVAKWNGWYPGVIGSWYVSDSDLANGRAIRNALMQNQNPDAWEWVQKTAADQPNRPAYKDRPAPIGPQKEPWKKTKPRLTVAQVKELQRRLNAMGWKPALKVDGVYGKKTQEAEAKLLGTPPEVKVEQAAAAASKAIAQGQKPVPKPMPRPTSPEPPKAPVIPPPGYGPAAMVLEKIGGLKTLAGAALGGVGGFLLGGPAGAAAGALSGGLLGSQFGSEEEE